MEGGSVNGFYIMHAQGMGLYTLQLGNLPALAYKRNLRKTGLIKIGHPNLA